MSDPDRNGQSPMFDGDGASHHASMSPGAQLAAYRQERGWTIEQVASQLNLAPRQVVALESDDYPALPGMAIVRGFIRAYAKLLKVDAAPLLATLGGETVLVHESIKPRKSLSTPFSEARLPSMSERPGLSSKWTIGLLLIALLGVAVWAWWQRDGMNGISSPVPTEVTREPVAPPLEAVPVPVPAPQPEEGGAQVPGAAPEAAVPATENIPSTAPPPAPSSPNSVVKPTESSVAEASAAAEQNALVLRMREDSWLEVRRASNNSVMLAKLVKAGETETIQMNEPVSLVVGNASGVEASLRGNPVPLKSGTGNVARLTLK